MVGTTSRGGAAPLGYEFALPDCIAARPASERSSRNTEELAEHDGRCFVRGVLPIEVDNGDQFRYGIWLQIDPVTYKRLRMVQGMASRFTASIANAAPPWQQKVLGAGVDVTVGDRDRRPSIVGAHAPWLQTVLQRGWTVAEYQAATARLR